MLLSCVIAMKMDPAILAVKHRLWKVCQLCLILQN